MGVSWTVVGWRGDERKSGHGDASKCSLDCLQPDYSNKGGAVMLQRLLVGVVVVAVVVT